MEEFIKEEIKQIDEPIQKEIEFVELLTAKGLAAVHWKEKIEPELIKNGIYQIYPKPSNAIYDLAQKLGYSIYYSNNRGKYIIE